MITGTQRLASDLDRAFRRAPTASAWVLLALQASTVALVLLGLVADVQSQPATVQQDRTARTMISEARTVGAYLAGMDYCTPDSSAPMLGRAMEIAQRTGAEAAGRFQKTLQTGYDAQLASLRRTKPDSAGCSGKWREAWLEERFSRWGSLLEGGLETGSPTANVLITPAAGTMIANAEWMGIDFARMDSCTPGSSTPLRERALDFVESAGPEVMARFQEKLQAGYDTQVKMSRSSQPAPQMCNSANTRQRERKFESALQRWRELLSIEPKASAGGSSPAAPRDSAAPTSERATSPDAPTRPTTTQQRQDATVIDRAEGAGGLLAEMDYCTPGSSTVLRTRAMEIVQPAGAEMIASLQKKLQAGYDARLKAIQSRKKTAFTDASLCGSLRKQRETRLESFVTQLQELMSKRSTSELAVPKETVGGRPVAPAAPARENALLAPEVAMASASRFDPLAPGGVSIGMEMSDALRTLTANGYRRSFAKSDLFLRSAADAHHFIHLYAGKNPSRSQHGRVTLIKFTYKGPDRGRSSEAMVKEWQEAIGGSPECSRSPVSKGDFVACLWRAAPPNAPLVSQIRLSFQRPPAAHGESGREELMLELKAVDNSQ